MLSWWEALFVFLSSNVELEGCLCIFFQYIVPLFLVVSGGLFVRHMFNLYILRKLSVFCLYLHKLNSLTSSTRKDEEKIWANSFLYSLIKLCKREYRDIDVMRSHLYSLIKGSVNPDKSASLLYDHLWTSLWVESWYEGGKLWILQPGFWGIKIFCFAEWWIQFWRVVLYWTWVFLIWPAIVFVLRYFGIPASSSSLVFLNTLFPGCGNLFLFFSLLTSVFTVVIYLQRHMGIWTASTLFGSLLMVMRYAYNIESFSDDLISFSAVDVKACNQNFILRLKDEPEVPTRFSTEAGFYTENEDDWISVASQLTNIKSIVIGGFLPILPFMMSHVYARGLEHNNTNCILLIKDLEKKYPSYGSWWVAPIPEAPSKPVDWSTVPSEIGYEMQVLGMNLGSLMGIVEKPVEPVVENVTSSWNWWGLLPAYVPKDDATVLWKCQSLNNAVINSIPHALEILEDKFAESWLFYHLYETTHMIRRQVILFLRDEDIDLSALEKIFVEFLNTVGPKGLGIGTVNGLKRLEWYKWLMGQT